MMVLILIAHSIANHSTSYSIAHYLHRRIFRS